MTTTEDRLRAAFAALERELEEPDLRSRRHPRNRRTVAIAAAAAVAAIVGVGTLVISRGDDGASVAVAARSVDAATFNARVAPACKAALAARHGQQPRFATSDAFRTVARQRQQLIRDLRSHVAAQPPPEDDRQLVAEVLAHLDVAEARANDLIAMADTADTEALQDAWPEIDDRIDDGLRALVAHGAEGCRP